MTPVYTEAVSWPSAFVTLRLTISRASLPRLRKTNMTEAIAYALRSVLKRERNKRSLEERLAELARQLESEAESQIPAT